MRKPEPRTIPPNNKDEHTSAISTQASKNTLIIDTPFRFLPLFYPRNFTTIEHSIVNMAAVFHSTLNSSAACKLCTFKARGSE